MTRESFEHSTPRARSTLGVAVGALFLAIVAGVGLYATRGSAGTEPDSDATLGANDSEGGNYEADGSYGAYGGVPWPFRYQSGQVKLPLRKPVAALKGRAYPQKSPRGSWHALPYQYEARVFERVTKNPLPMGIVRRGTRMFAKARVYGPGCKGAWYPLSSEGYVCTSDGFHVSKERRSFDMRQLAPALDQALPYRYAKMRNGALRYYRPPTVAEEKSIAAYYAAEEAGEEHSLVLSDVVEEKLDGAYFVAVDRQEKKGKRRFFRTVRGRYVHVADVEPRALPPMHGELLGDRWKLPIAFVYGEKPVEIYRDEHVVGMAEKHGRVPASHVGKRWVVGPGKYRLPRARVRVARRIPVPDGVPDGAKWVHVDLTEQTLVAYEGRRPVFATLVSSGLEEPEFATPTGVYQVREKHVSVTMNGPDPDAGRYEVEEVPWTQYYYDSYAIHGAYWHDEFGQVRSHGCTNLAPTDARWLFHWTDPGLPPGWHARRRAEGSYLVFTRQGA